MLKKYKIALSILTILVIGLILLGVGYLYYDAPIIDDDHAFVYVDGSLSFNFIEGNQIDTKEEEVYHFSVTNTSSDPYYYYLSLTDVKGTGAEFEVKSNREGFQTITKAFPDSDYKFANTIKINGNETHSYTLTLKNPTHQNLKGTILIGLEKEMTLFANVILKNNVLNSTTATKVSENIATEEEGLMESEDDDGISYYFRGNVSNNYVSFADLLWRIVKINGDGTVKLILNDLSSSNVQFYGKDEYYDLDFSNSNIYKVLDNWYQQYLGNYDSFIANYKYCTDSTYDDNGFSTLTRIYTNHGPLYQCLGTVNALKVGLLTADEVSFAGATNSQQNKQFYLYNAKAGWWTMSPAKNINGTYSFIEVNANGQLNDGTIGSLFRGVRPVINLVRKTIVTGTGTEKDPYIVNLM